MIRRGNELTLRLVQDPSMFKGDETTTSWGEERGEILWSNRGGQHRQLIHSAISPTLCIAHPSAPSGADHHVDDICLTLGTGLGRAITDISSMVVEGDVLTVQGTADLTWQPGFQFTAKLDRHLIIRKLEMQSKISEKYDVVLSVTTEGIQETEGFPAVATSAQLLSLLQTQGKERDDPTTRWDTNFTSSLTRIEHLPNDEAYDAITTISPPEGTIIIDRSVKP